MSTFGKIILIICLITVTGFVVIDYYRDHFFVFDPERLHQIALEVVKANLSTKDTISELTNQIYLAYPDYIDDVEEWMFNVAGGAMGHMTLLHCSITEYIIIFGSPIGTEGFSGRFFADDYFTILEGEQWSFEAGELDPRVFKAGDRNIMPRGHATGYKFPSKTYALGTNNFFSLILTVL